MNTKTADWNPKYVAFAAAQGRTPEEQKAYDAPKGGARNVDFMAWASKRSFKLICVDGTDMNSSPAYWDEWFETKEEATNRAAEVNANGVKVRVLHTRMGICG